MKLITTIYLIGILNCPLPKDTLKNSKPLPKDLKKLIESLEKLKKEKHSNGALDLEIDGLLFDETKTKSGRDFYDYFFNKWVAPSDAKNYSITIKELPYRLRTTQIKIFINENLVVQSFLSPRMEAIEQLAQNSITRVANYLKNYDQIQQMLNGSDQSGNGIF